VLPSQRRDSASWSEIFAELQDELRLDAAPLDPAAEIDQPRHWLPPTQMEPMTDDEAEQARSLLSAQLIAIEALDRRKKSTGRHLAIVRSLPSTRTPGGPVYLDISG
jgi:hypothetical protein